MRIRRDEPMLVFECFRGGQEIIGALAPMGYSFFNAEGMRDDLGAATNFLALPKRHSGSVEELRRRCEEGAVRA